MRRNKKLNALEALDVGVLLKNLFAEQALNLVVELVKKVHFMQSMEEIDYCISTDCHYHEDEKFIKMMEDLKTFGLSLVDLLSSIIEAGKSLPIEVDTQIDIKNFLLVMPSEIALEIIDMCLEYIETLSPFEEYVENGQDIAELKELKATLIAIREEETIDEKHSEEWNNLPF